VYVGTLESAREISSNRKETSKYITEYGNMLSEDNCHKILELELCLILRKTDQIL
jgi:hypothetical protein